MEATTTVLLVLVRILFLIQVVLGISFWTGHELNLIGMHMLLGLALVGCLWASAIVAAVARVQLGIIIAGLVVGAIVIALGLTQTTLLPGAAHWTIQVLHLLVGAGAIGLNERLNRSTKQRLT